VVFLGTCGQGGGHVLRQTSELRRNRQPVRHDSDPRISADTTELQTLLSLSSAPCRCYFRSPLNGIMAHLKSPNRVLRPGISRMMLAGSTMTAARGEKCGGC
jgi:hypothetical protein